MSIVTIAKQLYDAVRATGLNWTEFCRENGLSIDRSNLRKMLIDDATMSTAQAEEVAEAVGLEFIVVPRRARKRRVA